METFEEYHDFTTATNWEKFSAELEATIRRFLEQGPDKLRKSSQRILQGPCGDLLCTTVALNNKLDSQATPYTVSLYTPVPDDSCDKDTASLPLVSDTDSSILCLGGPEGPKPPAFGLPWWCCRPAEFLVDGAHKLQHWFGVDTFIVVAPASYNGRILDDKECSLIVSAASIALHSAKSSVATPVPSHVPAAPSSMAVLCPVGGSYHDAYMGVAMVGQHYMRLESNAVRVSSSPPSHLVSVSGQLQILSDQLTPYSSGATAAVRAVLGDVGIAQLASVVRDVSSSIPPAVFVGVLRSYAVPSPVREDDSAWDDGELWTDWCRQGDPVGSLEVDVLWEYSSASVALQDDATNVDHSHCWRMVALEDRDEYGGSALRLLSIKARESVRNVMSIRRPPDVLNPRDSGAIPGDPVLDPRCGEFAKMMASLAQANVAAASANSIGELMSPEWWASTNRTMPPMPPAERVQDAVRDILSAPSYVTSSTTSSNSSSSFNSFSEGARDSGNGFVGGGAAGRDSSGASTGSGASNSSHSSCAEQSRRMLLPKTAPWNSLTTRLALHVMVFGNLCAIAALWTEFVHQLRFLYWETGRQLPGMCTHGDSPTPGPDWSCCLLHQKLQMLNLCIQRCAACSLADESSSPHQRQAESWNKVDDSQWSDVVSRLPPIETRARQNWMDASQLPGAITSSSSASSPKSFYSGHSGVTTSTQLEPGDSLTIDLKPSWNLDGSGMSTPADSFRHFRELTLESPEQPPGPSESGVMEALKGMDKETAGPTANGCHPPDGIAGGQGESDVPRGVLRSLSGVTLIHHPDRCLNIPVTQGVAMTEDTVGEQMAVVAACKGDAQLRHRVINKIQADLLLSDMAAFRAANPGAVFDDFLRWKQPSDYLMAQQPGEQLSPKAVLEHISSWQSLWSCVSPRPAELQTHSTRLEEEGERVMHWLETLSPLHLMHQLTGCALNAQAHLLAESSGGQLDTSQNTLRRFLGSCRAVVGDLINTQQSGHPQQDPIVPPNELAAVVHQLQYLERVVLCGASLLRRLPTHEKMAEELLRSIVRGQTRDAATPPPSSCQGRHMHYGLAIKSDVDRQYVDGLMNMRLRPVGELPGEGGRVAGDWPGLLASSWLLQVHDGREQDPVQRLHVLHKDDEVRVVMTLVANN